MVPQPAPTADWQPYVYRRAVRWADTDTAAIAYTGALANIMLEAIEFWYRERLDLGWYQLAHGLGMGTPFVKFGVEFKSPVTPDDDLLVEVRVTSVGRSSTHFAVEARGARRGIVHFTGTATNAFVAGTPIAAIAIPEPYRSRISHEAAMAAAWAAPDGA